jgi:salicylate hydroxylase
MEKNPLTKQLYDDPSLQLWLAPGRHSIARAVPKRDEYDIQVTDHGYGFEPDGSVGTWNERITDLSWLRDRFKDFNPAIRAILAEATSCWKWRIAETAALPSWTSEDGRVVLVGDSCHAMVPFAGQGAAQCIEDAAVLSELLSKTSLLKDIPNLTKKYEELRKPRVERVRAYARVNGVNYTLPDGDEQKRRDEILKTSASKVVGKGGKVPFGDMKFAKWLDDYDAIKDVCFSFSFFIPLPYLDFTSRREFCCAESNGSWWTMRKVTDGQLAFHTDEFHRRKMP